MDGRVSLRALQQTKDDGRKIAGVVARVYQIARILDGRASTWCPSATRWASTSGDRRTLPGTMGQTVTVAQAVRRGGHACAGLCRLLLRSLQEGTDAVVQPTIRFVKEAGVDVVKLDAASDYPEAVTAITRAGIPVFAQFGSRCRRRWATAWSTSPSPGHVNLTWPHPDGADSRRSGARSD